MNVRPDNLKLDPLPPPPPGMTDWPWNEGPERLLTKPNEGREWPRISIVTPSYNQAAFLEKTIRSVLLQGYPNLEYIIVDGGSTDGSVDIIRKYEPWLTSWISEHDWGQSDAINKGFLSATGEILAWINSDDYYAGGALAKVVDAFTPRDAAIGAVVGIGHKVDSEGQVRFSPLPSSITHESLIRWCRGQNFMQPACFFTREAWQSAGPLRLDLDFCMDLALWFRMADRYRFKVIEESLAFIHMHPSAKTVAQRPRMFGEVALLLANQRDGWPEARELLFWVLDGMGKDKPGAEQ